MIGGTSLVIIFLTLQRSASSLILHEAGSRVAYSTALAVLLGELLKQFISFLVLLVQMQSSSRKGGEEMEELMMEAKSGDSRWDVEEKVTHTKRTFLSVQLSILQEIYSKIMSRKGLVLLIPASLYVAQNNLFLYSSARLSPSIFQVSSTGSSSR
jgi:hypothetical protein